METYLNQLLSDLQAATLERWRKCPPHFYQMGISDPMQQPPEGFVATQEPEGFPDDFETSIAEMEEWMHDEPAITMYDHFGFKPEEFPPANTLTEAQAQSLIDALVPLWVAYNLMPTIPSKTPAFVLYPHMLERMAQPVMLMEHGVNGIEFCYFNPEECPFGLENCSCREE